MSDDYIKYKDSEGVEHTAILKAEMPCTFCGGHVHLGHEDGEPVAFHSDPPCETFKNAEFLDFIELNRAKLAPN